jgi:hypothetical protein
MYQKLAKIWIVVVKVGQSENFIELQLVHILNNLVFELFNKSSVFLRLVIVPKVEQFDAFDDVSGLITAHAFDHIFVKRFFEILRNKIVSKSCVKLIDIISENEVFTLCLILVNC